MGYKIYQAPNIINVPPQVADYILRFTRRMKEEPRKEDTLHTIQRYNTPLVFILKNSDTSVPASAMKWNKEAREFFRKTLDHYPEAPINLLVGPTEAIARKKGYTKVTRQFIVEQMQEMGLDLNTLLTAGDKQKR